MGVLMTDELIINVKFQDRQAAIMVCYGDYFKALYEKAYESFGIDPLERAKYAIYEPNGAKLPKTAQIYNVAEVSDGAVVEMKQR